jgi:ATP-dependent Lon protease
MSSQEDREDVDQVMPAPSSATDSQEKTQSQVPSENLLPPNLFILPVNHPIAFPTLLAPLLITHPRCVAMVDESINRERMMGLLLVRDQDSSQELPTIDKLYSVGVAVKIIKRLKMQDGSVNLFIHSIKRFRVKKMLSQQPYIVVETEYLEDELEKSTEMDALTRSVISQVKKLSEMNPFFTDELRLAMINAPGPGTVADLVAFALSLPKEDAQLYLETLSVKKRFQMLLLHLKKEQDVADVQRRINEDINDKLTKNQREFYLREQLRSIKRELGMDLEGKEKLSQSFQERIHQAEMPEEAKKIALEELEKFEAISEQSPEYNICRNYLEVLCSLPWNVITEDHLDLDDAQKTLDSEHYGLKKVKERIIEFLAVRQLKSDTKGSMICLVGPPGVGKTSIGRSIAQTLGRKFFRFSLGGMRDEAEIKGHRRTYIGAMPGKIIQGLKRTGSKNPVFLLDEIDKMGQSFQGDPASALLEVLDPEQNSSYLDHYLDIPFDLSQILFITTANSTSSIPLPLLDRMEIIELPGYTLEEKEDIARRYVIPKELKANGIELPQLTIEKAALKKMLTDYAREPGLRSLQKIVGQIARKAATQIITLKKSGLVKKNPLVRVQAPDLVTWLGPKRFYNEVAERIVAPGIVVGLAWTSLGGDTLFIEAADIPGSGALKLTGQMGEVMTESATIAWSYVKKKCSHEKTIEKKFLQKNDIHLHIPAGAIPKDGPSAGITMAAALYSLLTGRIAKSKLAMTGELSLTGKVLPVGGIKEKILAAKRAGVHTLILPQLNKKDMVEVPDYAHAGMTIHFVHQLEEVFDLALIAEKKKKPLKRTKS